MAERRSCGCSAQLANVLSTEQLFYACIIPFIIFFGSFAFFMYPLRDVLHPTGACPISRTRSGVLCSTTNAAYYEGTFS